MSIFGTNKFTVEQQIVRAMLQSGDNKLEQEAKDEIDKSPTLGTIANLQSQKFTQTEIQEVELYIKEQRIKYPGSLTELFEVWERLVIQRKNILLDIKDQNRVLANDVKSNNADPTQIQKSDSIRTETNNILKYSIKGYEGYAIQELQKSGKTIKDLQEKLKEKKFYTGEINGKFDQSTLDAIFAFQKSIPHPVYGEKGVDGLVGSQETIPALFGIPAKPNTAKQSSKVVTGVPHNNQKPVNSAADTPSQKPTIQPLVPVKNPEKSTTVERIHTELTTAYNEFINYAKSTDKFLAGFRNSKEDIQKIQQTLSEKGAKFNTLVDGYIKAGADVEKINWMRLNIAYYYTDDLQGVSSNNQMNIVGSMNLCIDILRDKISGIPSMEQQESDTMDKIGKENPKLAELISKKIAEQIARNESPNLSAILSNPMIKGSWEKASDEIYGSYLKKLDNELDTLKGQKNNSFSDSQKKALNHLRDIRGKDGTFDFTVQNREQMWQMLKYGSAIAAGIVAAIPTGGASLGALALGAGVSATVVTAGGILAQGYHGSFGEIAGEAGINLISFGGGAVLFKVASGARAASFAEKTSKFIVYGAEGIGNISIGVATDTLRARLRNEDLDTWSAIQQNLIWAALPFALRMKGSKVPPEVINDASQVNEAIRVANAQAALGKSPKNVFEKIKTPLDRLKTWGQKNNSVEPEIKTNVVNKSELPDIKPTTPPQDHSSTHNIHGQPVEPIAEVAGVKAAGNKPDISNDAHGTTDAHGAAKPDTHHHETKPGHHDHHNDSHGGHGSDKSGIRTFTETYLTSGNRSFIKLGAFNPNLDFWKNVHKKGWSKEIAGYLKDQTIDQLFDRILKAVDASKKSAANIKEAHGVWDKTKAVAAFPLRNAWEWAVKLPLAPSWKAVGLGLGVGTAESYYIGSELTEEERAGRNNVIAGWEELNKRSGAVPYTNGIVPQELAINMVQANLLGWLGVYLLNAPEAPVGVAKATTETFWPNFVGFLENIRNTGQMLYAIPTQVYDAQQPKK
ncbi:hypothetical protein K2X92_02330 [Candidatus Gracilibacteria bacterium]|nr:hypothetical protein [Candidatus Gracilibacteria bacterium]